jgi:polysaccharide export outer membrane protein
MENPYLLVADLRSQRETLMNEYARVQARIARVETELGRKVSASDMLVGSPIAAEIRALEVESLDTRKADFEKEGKHLTAAIQLLSANLSLLEKQKKTEAERAKIDQEDLERVESLLAKGMIPITRLSDTKRLVLLSASRATEIEARSEQVKKLLGEEERKLQKLHDERRIELLRELQDAKIGLAATESKLSAVAEKMFLVGAIRSQIGRGGTGSPELIVFRRAAGGERIVANEETELKPRDVIEISLHIGNQLPGEITSRSEAGERLGSLPNKVRAR